MAIAGKKLSQPVIDKAVEMLSTGEYTHNEIGDQLDISSRSVKRIKKEHQDVIEQKAIEMAVEILPEVADNHIKTIQIANTILNYIASGIPDDNSLVANLQAMGMTARDIIKLADKKELRTLEIARIKGTHTEGESVFLQLINQQANIVITEDMQEFMKWKAQQGARKLNLPDNTDG
jgi:hypothetical protein